MERWHNLSASCNLEGQAPLWLFWTLHPQTSRLIRVLSSFFPPPLHRRSIECSAVTTLALSTILLWSVQQSRPQGIAPSTTRTTKATRSNVAKRSSLSVEMVQDDDKPHPLVKLVRLSFQSPPISTGDRIASSVLVWPKTSNHLALLSRCDAPIPLQCPVAASHPPTKKATRMLSTQKSKKADCDCASVEHTTTRRWMRTVQHSPCRRTAHLRLKRSQKSKEQIKKH